MSEAMREPERSRPQAQKELADSESEEYVMVDAKELQEGQRRAMWESLVFPGEFSSDEEDKASDGRPRSPSEASAQSLLTKEVSQGL